MRGFLRVCWKVLWRCFFGFMGLWCLYGAVACVSQPIPPTASVHFDDSSRVVSHPRPSGPAGAIQGTLENTFRLVCRSPLALACLLVAVGLVFLYVAVMPRDARPTDHANFVQQNPLWWLLGGCLFFSVVALFDLHVLRPGWNAPPTDLVPPTNLVPPIDVARAKTPATHGKTHSSPLTLPSWISDKNAGAIKIKGTATSAYWQAAVMQPEAAFRAAETVYERKPVTVVDYLSHLFVVFEKERRRVEQLPTDLVDSDLVEMVRQHLAADAQAVRTCDALLPWLRTQKIANHPFDPARWTEEAWAGFEKLLEAPPPELKPAVDALKREEERALQREAEIIAMRKKLEQRYGNVLPLPAHLLEEK